MSTKDDIKADVARSEPDALRKALRVQQGCMNKRDAKIAELIERAEKAEEALHACQQAWREEHEKVKRVMAERDALTPEVKRLEKWKHLTQCHAPHEAVIADLREANDAFADENTALIERVRELRALLCRALEGLDEHWVTLPEGKEVESLILKEQETLTATGGEG